MIGRRVLQRGEGWLLRVPVFRTIYAPVKQLVVAFSPDNESGFKRVVMVEDRAARLRARISDAGVHGRSRAAGPEPLLAVYVPTNHLYLGDIVICERDRATLSRHHGRGRHPDFPDRRHGAAAQGTHIIAPFARGSMIVTVQRLLRRRLVVPVLAILFCGALVALPRARAGAGGAAGGADGRAPAHAGGEANLVLPDLSAVELPRRQRPDAADGRPGGLRARPAVRPDDVRAAQEPAGARVDAAKSRS